jgi:hypothetical protein
VSSGRRRTRLEYFEEPAAVEAGGPAHALLLALDQAARQTGVPLRALAWRSDNRRYAAAGLPTVGIGMGIPGYQTPAEMPNRVQPAVLATAVRLLVATVHNLATTSVLPPEAVISEIAQGELAEMIEQAPSPSSKRCRRRYTRRDTCPAQSTYGLRVQVRARGQQRQRVRRGDRRAPSCPLWPRCGAPRRAACARWALHAATARSAGGAAATIGGAPGSRRRRWREQFEHRGAAAAALAVQPRSYAKCGPAAAVVGRGSDSWTTRDTAPPLSMDLRPRCGAGPDRRAETGQARARRNR